MERLRKRRKIGGRDQPGDPSQGSSQQQIVTTTPEASHSDAPNDNPLSLTQLCEGTSSDIVDIVFVHGLTGGSYSTWLHKDNRVYWPSQLLPDDVQDARTFAFGYDADIVKFWNPASKNAVSNHAENMLGDLVRAREETDSESRKIIFVAHSLGGLVTQDALRISRTSAEKHIRQIERSTIGILFLGTPHHGSDLAAWGVCGSRLVNVLRSSNSDIVKVLKPGSEMLSVIQKDFQGLLRSRRDEDMQIMITCFYEELPVPLVGEVVPKHSAILPGYSAYGIHADHVEMTRFSGPQDPGYGKVLGELRRWIKSIYTSGEVENAEFTQEQQECLRSLFFPEMNLRERDIDTEADETCTWLLQSESYKAWLPQRQGLFWIKGKPGAGKSTLVKHAVDTFKQQRHPKNTAMASFFFSGRGVPIQKTPLGLFRSLLYQLSSKIPNLLLKLTATFVRKRATEGEPEKRWSWHERELQDLLSDFLQDDSRMHSIWVFVDALDECGEQNAVRLADYFQRLVSQRHSSAGGLKICFSCRHYPIIVLKQSLEVCVEDRNRQDIINYVEQKLADDEWQSSPAQEIRDLIATKAEGTFQWVCLVVPRVLQLHRHGTPISAIKRKIGEIPTELNELYKEILADMQGEELSQSFHLLQWICFSIRPLSLAELRIAMVVDKDRPENSLIECQIAEDFVQTDEVMERRVTFLSRGLAQVSPQRDKRIVQVIHQSVKDYLTQEGLNLLSDSSNRTVVGCAHLRLSISCIKYLSFPELDALSEDLVQIHRLGQVLLMEQVLKRFSFLEYATKSWTAHAVMVEEEQIIQDDLIRILHRPAGRNMLKHWIDAYQIVEATFRDCPSKGMTLLHVAANYGLLSIIDASLRLSAWITDSRDERDRTPLSWAAAGGHEAVVRLLLEQGNVEVNSRDMGGRTPLLWAVMRRHEAVVRVLVARNDVHVDLKDKEDQTALSLAALRGQETVIMLLLNRGARADSRNGHGRTPLALAAVRGREAVVRLLLNWGVEVDSKDNYGWTPLSHAAIRDEEAVVRLLLECGAVAGSKNINGRTPLLLAAMRGNEAVVRLLVSRDDVNVNSEDKDGHTALWWARKNGHQEIIRLLERRSDPQ